MAILENYLFKIEELRAKRERLKSDDSTSVKQREGDDGEWIDLTQAPIERLDREIAQYEAIIAKLRAGETI
jgi:hypothetical protein